MDLWVSSLGFSGTYDLQAPYGDSVFRYTRLRDLPDFGDPPAVLRVCSALHPCPALEAHTPRGARPLLPQTLSRPQAPKMRPRGAHAHIRIRLLHICPSARA